MIVQSQNISTMYHNISEKKNKQQNIKRVWHSDFILFIF